jgi:hypothetical protein
MKKFIYSISAIFLILALNGCTGTGGSATAGVDTGDALIAAIPAD